MIFGLGFSELILVMLMLSIVIYPAWRILRRLGFSGAWSLLIFIPLVNLLALYVLAFTPWPLERGVAPRD